MDGSSGRRPLERARVSDPRNLHAWHAEVDRNARRSLFGDDDYLSVSLSSRRYGRTMARRQAKKHKEHTRKPLTEERKQALFAEVVKAAQEEAGRQTLVDPDSDDLAQMAEDDASDIVERPLGRIRRTIARLARFVRS